MWLAGGGGWLECIDVVSGCCKEDLDYLNYLGIYVYVNLICTYNQTYCDFQLLRECCNASSTYQPQIYLHFPLSFAACSHCKRTN